jgi:hypothetical protein
MRVLRPPPIWPPWSQSESHRDRIDSQRTASVEDAVRVVSIRVGWSEIRTEGHEGNEEGVRMATHSWTVSSLKRRIARRRAECRRFGQAFGSSASLPSCSSVHNLFAPVIGGNDTSPRVDPRARRLVDPWGTAKSRRPPHAISAAQDWAGINFPISMQTLRAAAHPRSHAPAWERTSCRSAACSRLIREVTPDLFLTIHGAMAIRPDLSINHPTRAARQSSIGEPENWRPSVAPWAGSASPRPEAGESRPTSRDGLSTPRRRIRFGDRGSAHFFGILAAPVFGPKSETRHD